MTGIDLIKYNLYMTDGIEWWAQCTHQLQSKITTMKNCSLKYQINSTALLRGKRIIILQAFNLKDLNSYSLASQDINGNASSRHGWQQECGNQHACGLLVIRNGIRNQDLVNILSRRKFQELRDSKYVDKVFICPRYLEFKAN